MCECVKGTLICLVSVLQHRYYGESVPFGSKEAAFKNASTLGYLNAAQALADFAILVTDLKHNLSVDGCPVVLFGGSYGGSKTFFCSWVILISKCLKHSHYSL